MEKTKTKVADDDLSRVELSFWGSKERKFFDKDEDLVCIDDTVITIRKAKDCKTLRLLESIPTPLDTPLDVHLHDWMRIGYISMMKIKNGMIHVTLPKTATDLRKLFNFTDEKKASMKIPVSDYYEKRTQPIYTGSTETKEVYYLKVPIPNAKCLTTQQLLSQWCGYFSASISPERTWKWMFAVLDGEAKNILYQDGSTKDNWYNVAWGWDNDVIRDLDFQPTTDHEGNSVFLQDKKSLLFFIQKIGCLKPGKVRDATTVLYNKCPKIRTVKPSE